MEFKEFEPEDIIDVEIEEHPDDFTVEVDVYTGRGGKGQRRNQIKKNKSNFQPVQKIDNYYDPAKGNNPNKVDPVTWIINNSHFDERPATIEEFLGPGYLNIDRTQNPTLPEGTGVRAGVKAALIDIFGPDIDPQRISIARRAMFTGGIGVGKSTLASIALTYMVHWVSCLNDPQAFFRLLPDSPIAFMIMSTKATQAREVLFGKVKGLVDNSAWFKDNALPNQGKGEANIKNQLRFPRNIWLVPGTSEETAFEGYDILGGVIDEGDSHKVTDLKDYADSGWTTIASRISSRFTDPTDGDHRGLLMVMGQMKKQDGFMARKKKELEQDDKAVVVVQTIWESFGWDYYISRKTGKVETFYFDLIRKIVVPDLAAQAVQSPTIIKIPITYKRDFESDPVKALRDLAGIPPAVEDPFISAVDRIDEAQDKWQKRFDYMGYTVNSDVTNPAFHPDFHAINAMKHAVHIDIGYSANGGDAMGMAMGHVEEIVEVDNEKKPYIVIDFVMRMRASGGQPLMLADFRQVVYYLRDELKFKIGVVTLDGFQSQDTIQILRQKRINTDLLSVDKTKGPYEDLRQAIYERRIEFPKYMTYLHKNETEKINIIRKELMELTDTGMKIDHPPKTGSKDCSDAIAGVTYVLMGNSAYRRGAARNYRKNIPQMMEPDLSEYGSPSEQSNPTPWSSPVKETTDMAKIAKSLGLPPIEHDPFARLRP